MGPTRQSDKDPYAVTLPMGGDIGLPMVAVADIGKAACAIIQDPSTIGRTVGVASETLTGKEIAEAFTKVCGSNVVFNGVPPEVYAQFGFPGADSIANMFRYKIENNDEFKKVRVVSEDMKATMGGLISFEEWITEHQDAFQLYSDDQEQARPQNASANSGPSIVCCSNGCNIM